MAIKRLTPVVVNRTMTLADTWYSYSLPAGTDRFLIKLRDSSRSFDVSFTDGSENPPTTYLTMGADEDWHENDLLGGSVDAEIWFRCGTADMVAEILIWKAV